MTTNKPEVVAWLYEGTKLGNMFEDEMKEGFWFVPETEEGPRTYIKGQPVVRLSDYETLQAELRHANKWRDLALQFDRHRMVAIALLRAISEGSAGDEDCHAFLTTPPMSALEITEHLEALQAECEKLRSRARAAEREYSKVARTLKGLERVSKVVSDHSDEVCAENNQLRVECKKLRKDAERYVPLNETVQRAAAPDVQGEPVAWMTHHDELMAFATAREASAYCDHDENPIPLYAAPQPAEQQPAPDVAGLVEALDRIANLPMNPCSTENDYRLSAAKAIALAAVRDFRDDALAAHRKQGSEAPVSPAARFPDCEMECGAYGSYCRCADESKEPSHE